MTDDRIPEQETLRDRFAMAALAGILGSDQERSYKRVAIDAYKFADAMLETRKKK